ncbi:acetylglutamate kinase [Paludibacterium purpuratum]|uniref:Acetylglutamate kinase n=1 Tax=Paludibacterium purpuratum TaxID=1144873 RepID=A0A4R7AXM9_9NEIS|nr:acetylglutamate kinase [Paludibacterium purpuratum]TDR72053.1 acetylglutamate kinase [Paludibacterium purpuratum]
MMSKVSGSTPTRQALLLRESLPFVQALHGQTVVIGFLGDALFDVPTRVRWMQDIALLALLGARPLLVHGAPRMRVGEQESPAAMRAAMSEVNFDLVRLLNREGVRAVGLTGQDARWAQASEQASQGLRESDMSLMTLLQTSGMIPALMACAPDANGHLHPLPPERFAAQVALRLCARSLVLVSEGDLLQQAGVQPGIIDRRALSAWLAVHERDALEPEVCAARDAVDLGVSTVHLVDAAECGGLISELMTNEGVGTVLCRRGRDQMLNDTARYFARSDSVIRPNFVAEHKWVVRF